MYGHVIELQLLRHTVRDKNGTIVSPTEEKFSMSGELNSSLLNLRYLTYLDLSGIYFEHGRIPEFLGSMRQLRHLDLSLGNFHGAVPRQLGNLTELQVFDLHDDDGDLVIDDTLWVSYLRSLNYLDMSGLKIAKAKDLMQVISMLPSLSHLSLSACGLRNFHLSSFRLGNSTSLVHLQSLDLSRNLLKGPIPNSIFCNMTSLQYLDLSLNSFKSSIPTWFDKFAGLIHLQYLDLSYNFLEGPIANVISQNMTSLRHLYLSWNSLNSSIPAWFDKFTSLVYLNLEGNHFLSIEGGLFSFLKSKKYLKSLRLGYNLIGDDISTSQGNSSGFMENNLEILILHSNSLRGALPNWLVHFTLLRYLLLGYNFFSGPIPTVIGALPNLVRIDLSYNQLNGTIPSSLGQLRALQDLHLYSNQLSGAIPDSFGELSRLSVLYLFSNSLEGAISETHFSNLSRLKYLDISDNDNLTFKAEHSWIPPFQLKFIRMNSCKFGTTFPQWMQTQVEVNDISLSNASISGALPKWFGNMTFSEFNLSFNQITGPLPNISSDCSILDLSHNLISGPLPAHIGEMYLDTLYLNDNRFNGTIPSFLCDMSELFDLNLGGNKLSGSIPNCWKGFRLSYLILSFNKLSGVIPSSIGSLYQLSTLHLNGNRLNGELPIALGNCTSLVILDLGENDFSGSIPTWFGESFLLLMILRLRENSFTGSIPPKLCSLSGLQILDMAVNNLTGMIPRCLGYISGMKNFNQDNLSHLDWNREHVVEILKGRYNEYTKTLLQLVVNMDLSSNNLIGSIPEELTFLAGLHGLNLSHNLLSGDIPNGIGDMKSLESLDLSNNRLSGTIPEGISALTSLGHLNLSHNNFTGQIPKGNQIQTLDDPSIYADNPLLCGDLLKRRCPGAEAPQAPKISHPGDTREEDKIEKALFCVVVMLGLATGFWGFFGVLQFKKDWRRAYFSFLDQAIDKAYVAILVKVAKLKRLRQSRST
ncbi:receptor-like protein EIX2 [Syzygium oleosum]|uniref:receptor-like protein EIX2 n=1 Tax=Syzygium oleosum TaxID=219896 RepID=UPI0024B91AC8|nr:receptor-like protein EIX2 [Syzygium oleosum]